MLKKSLLFILIYCYFAAHIFASCPTNCNQCCSSFTAQNSCNINCACPCSGKTFFFNRPLFQSYRPELWASFRNDVMAIDANQNNSENWFGGALDIVAYGGQSTNSKNLAQYFLPYCKQVLTVREKVITGDGTDLEAQNFGIYTINGANPALASGFVSQISFTAKHAEVGVGFHWKQGFLYDDDVSTWFYFDVDLPITYVANQFLIQENIIDNGGGANPNAGVPAYDSMTAAMTQPAWCYGKVSNCCKLSKTAIADIELKFGRQFVYNDSCLFAGYIGILLPTGTSPCGKYIFEPIVGHGKSFGFLWGTEGGYEIWRNCSDDWQLWLDFGCQAMYLFGHTQMRSFDLKNKPWSRYIQLYSNQAQAQQAADLTAINPAQAANLFTPGINLLTQPAQVIPGFQTNLTTSCVFQQNCGINIEIGYNGFFRASECVKLNWQTGPAIKFAAGDGNTNPVRNITGNPLLESITVSLSDYGSSLIQLPDIDMQSAAHPEVIIHLLYAQLGYKIENQCMPTNVSFGGSYEFALKNFGVMNRWTLWGKFSIIF